MKKSIKNYILLSVIVVLGVAVVVAIANARPRVKTWAEQGEYALYWNEHKPKLNDLNMLDKRQSIVYKKAYEDCDQDYLWFGREKGTALCRQLLNNWDIITDFEE